VDGVPASPIRLPSGVKSKTSLLSAALMLVWWNVYLVVFLMSGIISLLATPLCKELAVLTGFVDRPRVQGHKRHGRETPLLGGVAMFTAWLLTVCFGLMAVRFSSSPVVSSQVQEFLPGVSHVSSRVAFIVLGALMATLLGLYDDRCTLSARAKLFGQIAIAIVAVSLGGVRISVFIHQPLISWAVSVFWVVLIINAINFFDNMDGLAVGTAVIAFCLFALAAVLNQQFFVASFGAAAAGAAVGFWFYNHYPATIFMGDSGSHFLGYMLAVCGALVTYYNPDVSTTSFPILVPLFILAIPLFDALAVTVIRLRAGKPVYIGDNNHISHRFVKMGMSRRRAVFMVHLLALVIGLGVMPLLWGNEATAVVSMIQALVLLLLVSVLQYPGRILPDPAAAETPPLD
jgi:UDP-GlcNAc:undecaprenyl-phosphate GlcNAc-1-phosphate transferase